MQSYYSPISVDISTETCNLDCFLNQLPGEVGSSVYPVYNGYSTHATYATSRSFVPSSSDLTPHSSLYKRPTYHPYQSETTRSPTRARFHIPGSSVVQNVEAREGPISPTRAQRPASVLKTDPHNRNKGRNVPSEAEVESLSFQAHLKPIVRGTPTYHILIPQALFKEPKCAEYYFRNRPIGFNLKNVPETGVKARDMLAPVIPKLDGGDDFVLINIKEREVRVRILWPGYKTFEKRIKTYSSENEPRTRKFIAQRLALMLVEFRKHIKDRRWEVDPSQEQWKLSTGSTDSGINVEELVITQIVHCGGSHWQMELWAPRS